MRKFESDRAKSEEVIAKKQGLTGSEIHSSTVVATVAAAAGKMRTEEDDRAEASGGGGKPYTSSVGGVVGAGSKSSPSRSG